MIQEDREILLTDLCARLPYDVIGLYSWKKRKPYNRELTGNLFDELKFSWDSTEDSEFLPYLRPMSSMTTEELIYYHDLCTWSDVAHYEFGELGTEIQYNDTWESIDYLNSIHVDYRGLIPMGLAIEVTKENNPYKE